MIYFTTKGIWEKHQFLRLSKWFLSTLKIMILDAFIMWLLRTSLFIALAGRKQLKTFVPGVH